MFRTFYEPQWSSFSRLSSAKCSAETSRTEKCLLCIVLERNKAKNIRGTRKCAKQRRFNLKLSARNFQVDLPDFGSLICVDGYFHVQEVFCMRLGRTNPGCTTLGKLISVMYKQRYVKVVFLDDCVATSFCLWSCPEKDWRKLQFSSY